VAEEALIAALVGCGRIGGFTRDDLRARLGPAWLPLSHVEGLAATPGIELVACCDADLAAARRISDRMPGVRPYSDYAELLKDVRPDIVSIATRTDVRSGVIEAAAAGGVRGLHCEKPLGFSVREVERLTRLVAEMGMSFTYGALRRYMPVFDEALAAFAPERLGPLGTLTVAFGRGGLLWTHSHSVDLLCRLAGDAPVAWMQASLELPEGMEARGGLVDCDPTVLSATIMFANGITGVITAEPGLAVSLGGRSGGLSVVADGQWCVERSYAQGLNADPPSQWRFERNNGLRSGRAIAFEELRDQVRGRAQPRLGLEEIVDQHRILFGLVASHLSGGRRVTPSEVDPDLTVTGRHMGLAA
jgi:predicted dehydrogenase